MGSIFNWHGWSGYATATLAIWLLLATAIGYLARARIHRLIERTARAGHRWLRLVARGCAVLAQRIDHRNREVMLGLQAEISRRQLEREFHRVAAAVEQDMTKFQHLERAINEHINLLGEDFERSTQVPPAPPGWVGAVDAIAKLQAENNPEAVGRVLSDIHSSVQDQQREVMREYRWVVNARHKILADLRPLWRKVGNHLNAVGRDSRDLLARAHRIDTLMAAFRELCANRADVRVDSFLARWLLALVLTGTALMLALLNTALLTGPFTLLLSAGPQPGDLAVWLAAAYTLALVAVALLLSECAQVTRLLALVGGLPRHSRLALTCVALLLLLALAAAEALLLSTAVAPIALTASLTGWGWAGIGLVLPLLLALLSPAVESLLATSRPVLASGAALFLTSSALLLRLGGRLWLELGHIGHLLFDLFLFLPLAAERALEERRRLHHDAAKIAPVATPNVTAVNFDKNRKAE